MKMIFSLAAAAAVALALGACGSSGGTATASDANARDTARLKLQQCLKQNGVDLPQPGAGGQNGGGGGGGFRQLSSAQRNKLQKAMSGPCAKYRNSAFGNANPQQRQQFQDAFAKFSDCMRQHGVDVPNFTPGQAPPTGARRINRNDPKVKAATQACSANLPNGGRFGGGGGPGGGAGGPPPAQ